MSELIKTFTESDNQQTFTSKWLCEQINIFREEENVNSILLHKNLLAKIESEFEEEIGRLKIQPTTYLDNFNRKQPMYELPFGEALQLLMSESKTVRKKCVQVMEAQANQIKVLQEKMPKDELGWIKYALMTKESEQLLLMENNQIKEQNVILLPLAETTIELIETDNTYSINNLADFLGITDKKNRKVGQNILYELLREHKILKANLDHNDPYILYKNKGWFISKLNKLKNGQYVHTTYVTPLGVHELRKLFKGWGYKSKNTNE